MKKYLVLAALTVGVGLLSACDTAEDRAEKHYQSGMELLEAGDVDRALVEFRNVFQLNGQHRDARRTYAAVMRDRGDLNAAYGQYLRLVEQYPDDIEGNRALAELAIQRGNWRDARQYAQRSAELTPDDPVVRATMAATAYQRALQDREVDDRKKAYEAARAVVATNPEILIVRQVVINEHILNEDWEGALAEIDAGLESHPEARDLYNLRLGALEQLGRSDEIEAQLRQMIRRFPDDQNLQGALVRWYMARGEAEAAEAFLRDRIEAQPDETEPNLTLVRFLAEIRGADAAREELDRIVAGNPPSVLRFRAVRAGLNFDAGERAEAVAEMEQIVDAAVPSDETRQIKVALARMLDATGNNVGARVLIEEVLEEDATHAEAAKVKADWLIQGDDPDAAISLLRGALGANPRDSDLMTLIARAHERAGNRELLIEMLALAVEASNAAPAETLRYASALMAEDRNSSAEEVLLQALRLAPGNVQLLSALGDLYQRTSDWARLDGIVTALRRSEDPGAAARADDLQARSLFAQNREGELMGFLENLAEQDEGNLAADVAMLRVHLSSGDRIRAMERVDAMLERSPDNPVARYLHGAVLTVFGQFDEAKTIFRTLLDEEPRAEPVWIALHNIELAERDPDAALATLDSALAVLPDSIRLNWAKAGLLERAGEIDGAIDIYERLYSANTENMVFANNLASLISTHRSDAESLERAHGIARRLRGSDVPQFQDTYGWIAAQRGDYDEALAHLEPAAQALSTDPRVQFHLARTYAALDRNDEALERLELVRTLLDGQTDRGLHAQVEAEIERISQASGTSGSAAGEN